MPDTEINYIKALIAAALSVIAGALGAGELYGSISTGEGQFKQIKGPKTLPKYFNTHDTIPLGHEQQIINK